MKLQNGNGLPALAPARLIAVASIDGQEWCKVADGPLLYWTPFAPGKLYPEGSAEYKRAESLGRYVNQRKGL